MKLTLHQHIALFWVVGAPGAFMPVIENAKRPDAGSVMAWGIAIVAMMILAIPMLLRLPTFRRWYGWTDALSERQRQALAQRNLRRYLPNCFRRWLYVPRDALRVAIHLDSRRVDGIDRRADRLAAHRHGNACPRCIGALLGLVSDRRDAACLCLVALWPVDPR